MIAKLRGVLDSLGDGWAVVDVGGVGYLTYCSAGTLASLPQRGQEVSLTIETVVREDHIHLYGFSSEQNVTGSACCKPCRALAPASRSPSWARCPQRSSPPASLRKTRRGSPAHRGWGPSSRRAS